MISTHPDHLQRKKENKYTYAKIITPFEKLQKRLNKEFFIKKYIGDIAINDIEFNLLLEDFKSKYKILKESFSHIIIDIPFAVTLVQIGIRYYDGKYWPHVAHLLDEPFIPSYQQGWIGSSFIETIKRFNKITLASNEKVNCILMHCFISDFYAYEFFDFLFNYYRIDLERDLTRNTSESFNILIEAMIKNDNRNRTYLLRQQTSDAICNNVRGSKIRIRRLLNLIDSCFWDETRIITGNHRITVLFNRWRNESNSFQIELKKYNLGYLNNKGKRCFLSPYIKVDYSQSVFKLIIPSQLLRPYDFSHNELLWDICIGGTEFYEQVLCYEAVTGYKTEEKAIEIDSTNLFQEISVKLISEGEIIKSFKNIKKDNVRFFDEDGVLLHIDTLPVGKVYAYSYEFTHITSQALVTNEKRNMLTLFYFDFQLGDIVRLPDGKIISIGKEIEEGLSQRALIKDAYVINGNTTIPLYNAAPTIIVKIPKSKVKGTALLLNNKRMRLFDTSIIEIPLPNRTGEIGYLINLDELRCSRDGIYTIVIDVPNEKKVRQWNFAVIKNLTYCFEEAPYIFNRKGTISFNKDLCIKSHDNLAKNPNENSFNFEITAQMSDLCFESLNNQKVKFFIKVPYLQWKFEDNNWETLKPDQVWYSDFPRVISFKFPEDTISLCMDEELDIEEDEDKVLTFNKHKTEDLFYCDVTRFISWFNRDKMNNTIFLKYNEKYIPFLDVITKSQVVSCIMTADYEKNILKGEIAIIGKSDYYVDILYESQLICEKIKIISGRISIPMKIYSGTYKILIYENEDDDTGFGISNYSLIYTYENELINPLNLEGKTLKIESIKSIGSSIFTYPIKLDYIITDLKKSICEDNICLYNATMVIKNINAKLSIAIFPIIVNFFDLNDLGKVYIYFIEDNDSISFLYDNRRKYIVKYEDERLPSSVRYRCYEDLYEGGFYFSIKFINKYVISKAEIDKATQSRKNFPGWYNF